MLFLSLFLTYPLSDVKRMACALSIGIACATFDEIHQLFIDGRSGQFTDVCIDTFGVALGICFVMAVYKIMEEILKKRKDGVLE